MPQPAREAPRRGPLARRLLVFALVNSLLLPLALAALPQHPDGRRVLQEAYGSLLERRQDADSWGPMTQAFEYVARRDRPLGLYAKIFFTRHVKFQYPPTALLPLWAMWKALPAAGWHRLLNAISLVFLLVSIAVSAGILGTSLRRRAQSGVPGILLGVWLAVAFYPLVQAYSLGQIQAWVNGLFALALACWLTQRPAAAGALVGLMCLIKPHYGLFALWGAWRRQWAFVAALLAVGGLGLAASLAVFGLSNHQGYLDVVAFLSRRGEAYFPNQSANGLLNRLLRNGNNLEWRGASFAPYHPWVFWGTTLSSLALVLAALAARGVRNAGGPADFCLLALTATVASPIAWEHHYGILPPIYAAALAWLAESPVLGRATLAWLALSYALTSNYWGVTNLLAETGWNPLQSHLYFGALLLLLALHALRARSGAAARP
jgi:hypothetical protein